MLQRKESKVARYPLDKAFWNPLIKYTVMDKNELVDFQPHKHAHFFLLIVDYIGVIM